LPFTRTSGSIPIWGDGVTMQKLHQTEINAETSKDIGGVPAFKPRGRFGLRQRFSRRFMLEARIDAIEIPNASQEEAIREPVMRLARNARTSLHSGEFERAWRNLITAERILLLAMNDEALAGRAATLLLEAPTVLPPAEAQPITDALAKALEERGTSAPGWRERVVEAQNLYERRIVHLYDLRERTSTRIMLISMILLALLVALLSVSLEGLTTTSGESAAASAAQRVMSPRTAILTLLFGGIGACLSALISFTAQGRVPSMFEGIWGTIARPLVGAVSGLIGYMLVTAGFVSLGGETIALTVVPFVFGFSERLVMGTVEKLETVQKM
jgi:hypothetical protein